MKMKIIILLVIVLLGAVFIVQNHIFDAMKSIFIVSTSKDYDKNLNPIKSFGNQQQQIGDFNCALEGDWLYEVKFTEKYKRIVKYQPENPADIEYIYTAIGHWGPDKLTIADGWVYFAKIDYYDGGETYYLCRTKEDGSRIQILGKFDDSNGGIDYVLTKEAIVYQNNNYIYIMNLDGTNKKRIDIHIDNPDSYYGKYFFLMGVDNGWIYFTKDLYSEDEDKCEEEDNLYRIRPDGTDEEKVLDLSNVDAYTVDKEQIFFARYSKKDDKQCIIEKSIHGEETILINSTFGCDCLNKEGDFIYFNDNNKIYRINVVKKGKEQLIYTFTEKNAGYGILLHRGDLLLLSDFSQSAYIKSDGTVIDLSDYMW